MPAGARTAVAELRKTLTTRMGTRTLGAAANGAITGSTQNGPHSAVREKGTATNSRAKGCAHADANAVAVRRAVRRGGGRRRGGDPRGRAGPRAARRGDLPAAHGRRDRARADGPVPVRRLVAAVRRAAAGPAVAPGGPAGGPRGDGPLRRRPEPAAVHRRTAELRP